MLEKFSNVLGLDAPPIQDADCRRRVLAWSGERPPDHPRHTIGFRPGRGLAGADRPDRLVGDNETLEGAGRNLLERGADLGRDHRIGATGLALLEALADAHDRGETAFDGRAHLSSDGIVRLSKVQAPLRVADDHKAASHVHEHRSAHLTGIGALGFPVHGLAPQEKGGPRQGVSGGGEGRGGRTDHDLDPGKSPEGGLHLFDQAHRRSDRHVHLPVRRDQGGAHD